MMKRFPIAPEGLLFIVPLLSASLISGLVGPFYVFMVFSMLSLFAIYFFRNPRRDIPSGDRVVLSPADGRVLVVDRCREGRFHLANTDKSSQENEQNALVVRREDGLTVLFIQIAGFVARRIVCYPRQGDHLDQGQILGMIRFGSRLDVYLPEQIEPLVKPGDKVRGGESILGAIR